MYEDSSWYSSFAPEFQHRRAPSGTGSGSGHRRKESLLQQPNGTGDSADASEPLPVLFEDHEDNNSPPEPTLSRRAKSYSDFYEIVKAQLGSTDQQQQQLKKRRRKRTDRKWEALAVPESAMATLSLEEDDTHQVDADLDKTLLQASQQEFLLYHDQLAMTERHLGTLMKDANSALKVLESLCQSFRAVDDQTSSFQARCDDLLTEKKRLQTLADDVGTDLHYYAYLDNVSRRLNAPGAGRLVDDDAFADVLSNLDSCIAFMTKNTTYRDAESYLARYQALLTKALHLLEVGFTNRLNKVSTEISKQIAATQSESARHALAYGRFEEMVLESYSLIPNIQIVMRSVYDQYGHPVSGLNHDIYANTAINLFHAYWVVRDRDLKPLIQHDLDAFRAEAKASIETSARNFVKQSYERSYNEASLFRKVFSIEPQYSTDPKSAFTALKSQQRSLVTGTNIAPIASNLQSVLHGSDLRTVCNIMGWITNEYLIEYDEDESPFVSHCREITARLLHEHLWTFTDAFFEAEIAKSITKAVVPPEALKIGPVTSNDVSSNAFPLVKKAIELLVMFDQSMPKERSQRNSPIIFSLLRESIAALHRAESRIKSSKLTSATTDADLFMIKNLLILKNELVTLEIGDIRNNVSLGTQSVSGRLREMQHFSQIWETLRPLPSTLITGIWSRVGSIGGGLSGYIPSIPGASSLWSRSSTPVSSSEANAKSNSAANAGGGNVDVHEQLDEELRASIVSFTKRWAGILVEAKTASTKLGGKNVAKLERELDETLERAFTGQGEVREKLREAVKMHVDAALEAMERERAGPKGGRGSSVTRV
ncbi:putative conserved oligomeric Golgi complex component 3 [Podospora australis]|uniref:Conserved oligomeric Golgi complex subunit 3 n=1 Tax=Podospora australis TaxID=1536484 RepID=A0AAN7AN38_9PEZI|nr:putative conserved oligomeric Golgi complex component 3 [Podospora australis]